MFDDLWICNNCGRVFEGSEIMRTNDFVGECHGTLTFEVNSCCPHCGSTDFDEAAHCELCDKVVSMDDLKGGACPECWEKIKKQYGHSAVKMAELFKKEETEFKLNPFLVWAFNEDREKIESILVDFLAEDEEYAMFVGKPISYEDFLDDDEETAVQLVAERGDIDE